MKKSLAYLFLASVLLTACGSSQDVTPADQVLDNSIFAEATSSNNLARCKDIKSEELKASCEQVIGDTKITNEAVDAMDKSKCAKVSAERFKTECETQVAAGIAAKNAESQRQKIAQDAMTKNDAKLCDQIADENHKASCKYNVLVNQAIAKKDPSICEGIGLKDMIDQCKAALKK